MQKHANLVDLVKSFPTSIYVQNLVSIQPRTSLVKFAASRRPKRRRENARNLPAFAIILRSPAKPQVSDRLTLGSEYELTLENLGSSMKAASASAGLF